MFDADRYPDMDNTRSDIGESINSLFEREKRFLQFLPWPNFTCFLRVRFANTNYVSVLRARGTYGEDSDVSDLFDLVSTDIKCRQFGLSNSMKMIRYGLRLPESTCF